MNLAPIVIFTYLRLESLKQIILSLKKNSLCVNSDLIIFSDGPKSKDSITLIENVRNYIKTIDGFKSIKVYLNDNNKGLANSIIDGISIVLKSYDSVIVLEDDLIISENFLSFMNSSLNYYKNNINVFSISGYTFCKNNSDVPFFLNRPWSWGWATWKNRWEICDWDFNSLSSVNNISLLDKSGSDLKSMFLKAKQGKISSWYVRFAFNQLVNNGLTLYPGVSKVSNEGFDNLATHTISKSKKYHILLDKTSNFNFTFSNHIQIHKKNQKYLLFKMSYIYRIFDKIVSNYLKI
jgi:hypothetical protein